VNKLNELFMYHIEAILYACFCRHATKTQLYINTKHAITIYRNTTLLKVDVERCLPLIEKSTRTPLVGSTYYWWTASIKPRLLFSRACYASWGLSLEYYLLQLVFSACVAAVKSHPVLHHWVVIFFWSSGIMVCTCMWFTFQNGVPLMR